MAILPQPCEYLQAATVSHKPATLSPAPWTPSPALSQSPQKTNKVRRHFTRLLALLNRRKYMKRKLYINPTLNFFDCLSNYLWWYSYSIKRNKAQNRNPAPCCWFVWVVGEFMKRKTDLLISCLPGDCRISLRHWYHTFAVWLIWAESGEMR